MQGIMPVLVILDTDIGPDCDDAGALAILHHLADDGKADILGITHCTSSRYGAAAIDAINRFFGRPDIPVGTLKREGFLVGAEYERYNRYIAQHYNNAYSEKPAEDAVRLLRRVLSGQPDYGVTFIAIGPLVNLQDLLNSTPDEFSKLSGSDLVKKKVKLLVTMAGRFEPDETGIFTPEWNVLMGIEAAREVFHKWPSNIVFCGWEIGNQVITGKKITKNYSDENPVKKAYELFSGGDGRNSWDLIAVAYSICGDCDLWELSEEGLVNIDERGVSYFSAKEGGPHRIMRNKASVLDIEQYMEGLFEKSCKK